MLPVLPSDLLRLHDVLIPDIYRQLGQNYSKRLFAKIDDGSTLKDVTWGQVLQDALALADSMDKSAVDPSTKTVGLLGASNYSFYISVVACWLNGWSVLLLSTRNSPAAISSLLAAVNASAIMVDSTYEAMTEFLHTQNANMSVLALQQLLPSTLHSTPIIFNTLSPKPTPAQLNSIAFYTHTSGSEGHPKPVPITHKHFLVEVRLRTAAKYAGSLVYAPVPLFHGMGFYAFTRWPIGCGIIPIFFNTKRPLSGENMLQHLSRLPNVIGFLPPSVLEEVAGADPAKLAPLINATRVFFGGAPIKAMAAESLIKAGVPLVNVFASSELGIMTIFDFPSEDYLADWAYVRFRDDHYTLHFVPVDDSDLRELIISPDADDAPAVINCKNPFGFTSHDLWSPHPNRSGLWRHVGRKDAVTVLSTGEKTDNKQLENLLLVDKKIELVVTFGSGKVLNGVIVQTTPTYTTLTKEEFVDMIWATIEHANIIIPQHSKLIRPLVLVADPDRPFRLTDKGTIRVKETLALYAVDIEKAYATLEGEMNNHAQAPRLTNTHDIYDFVQGAVQRVLSSPIEDTIDFFDFGMDSLKAVQLRWELLPVLKMACNPVPHNIIFSHSSISSLMQYVKDSPGHQTNITPCLSEAKLSRINAQIQRFTGGSWLNGTSKPEHRRSPVNPNKYSIVLTGATGSLGSHILHSLLLRSDVQRIWCLQRAGGHGQSAIDRQVQAFTMHGIPQSLLDRYDSKPEFIAIDLSHPTLGLHSEVYKTIQIQATHIIHAAWELNFNWEIGRFKTHLAGVRHLIDLAISVQRDQPIRLIFLSSIGAVQHAPSPVPEEPFNDPLVSSDLGYGEGKYVAERIIDHACQYAGLHATILRAGQLSGNTADGFWAPSEYVPILLRSSRMLSAIPEDMPDARWLPTDVVAQCVLDLALRDEASSCAYFNLENTFSTSWSEIVRLFIEAGNQNVKPVPTSQWIKLVEHTVDDKSKAVPAAALLQFFTGFADRKRVLTTLSAAKGCQISPRIAFGPIKEDLFGKYLKQIIKRP